LFEGIAAPIPPSSWVKGPRQSAPDSDTITEGTAITAEAGMSDDMAADFALAAVREDGVWSVVPMPPAAADDLDQIIHALHQQPGDAGAVEEDFFVILRCVGDDVRMLLSDVTAAFDAPFAGQVLDRLGLPMPDGDDEDDIEPAGDLDLLADLGVSPLLLAELCDDLDLYPDDVFSQLAEHMGFSEQYDAAMQLVA
jgi:putative tRNA adenosine deaminase-associated protein